MCSIILQATQSLHPISVLLSDSIRPDNRAPYRAARKRLGNISTAVAPGRHLALFVPAESNARSGICGTKSWRDQDKRTATRRLRGTVGEDDVRPICPHSNAHMCVRTEKRLSPDEARAAITPKNMDSCAAIYIL